MRMITWTVMGLILIALWFWFDSWIAVRGLAISSRGNWDLVASGWHVVLSLWPLTLLGGLIGGTAAWAVASYLWLYITDVEHRREIAAHTANCEQRVQAASARAEQAEQRAANAMTLATQQAERQLAALRQEAQRQLQQAQTLYRTAQAEQARCATLQSELAQKRADAERQTAKAGAVLQRANKKLRQHHEANS